MLNQVLNSFQDLRFQHLMNETLNQVQGDKGIYDTAPVGERVRGLDLRYQTTRDVIFKIIF